jgi:FtsP/CotA-like multicopper oxidase with cupredoxin domain
MSPHHRTYARIHGKNYTLTVMLRMLLVLCFCAVETLAEFLTKKTLQRSQYMLTTKYMVPSPVDFAPNYAIHSYEGKLDVQLSVEYKTVTVSPLFSYKSRVFCHEFVGVDQQPQQGYCGATNGPSIHVRQGDKVTVTLINRLENVAGTTSVANSTNFYLRGVRLNSRDGPVANKNAPLSLRGVRGGMNTTYTFQIPTDHAPGMHWYQSNVVHNSNNEAAASDVHVSSVGLHMMSGLMGTFHVLPKNPDQVLPLQLQKMPSHELVFSHVMLNENSMLRSGGSAGAMVPMQLSENFGNAWNLTRLSKDAGSDAPMALAYDASNMINGQPQLGDVVLTNGKFQPKLTSMQGNEWTVFNLFSGSSDRILELEVTDSIGKSAVDAHLNAPGSRAEVGCETWLLAMDGTYLNAPRSADNTKHLVLLPGSRASVAVKCPGQAGTTKRYYLQSLASSNRLSKYYSVGTSATKTTQVLAVLDVTGDVTSTSTTSIANAGANGTFVESQVSVDSSLDLTALSMPSRFDSLTGKPHDPGDDGDRHGMAWLMTPLFCPLLFLPPLSLPLP